MNRPETEKQRPSLFPRHFRPLLGFFLVGTLLSFLVPDFFRQLILLPLLELYFSFYRLYRSLPQNVTWGLLIGVALVAALRVLWVALSIPKAPGTSRTYVGRVDQLASLAAEADTSDYARWQLAQELEAIIWRIWQRQHGESAVSIKNRIASGEILVAPEITAILDVCRSIPNYRRFNEERRAAGRRPIAALAALDLDGALQAIETNSLSEYF